MKRPGQSATDRLARALRGVIAAETNVESIASQSWSSITFSGERHQLQLRVAGPDAVEAAGAFRSAIAGVELEIPGHVLIDLAVLSEADCEDGSIRLDIEALTVESR